MPLIAAARASEPSLAGPAVARMLAGLSDCPCDEERLWQDAGVALGCRRGGLTSHDDGETLPLVDEVHGVALTADARLDDRDALCERLGVTPSLPDGRLLLAAFRRWGPECVQHLHGDYAFVVADRHRGSLFCARDALGVRPLYYAPLPGGGWACASDVRAVRAAIGDADDIDAHLDVSFVLSFLADYRAWHPSATFDARIRKVPTGHRAWFDAYGARVERWWHPERIETDRRLTLDEAVARVAPVVTAAVRDRLRAARGVGVHVSGGLDSGLVAAQAAHLLRQHGRPQVRAYGWTPTLTPQRATREEARLAATARHLNLDVVPCDLTRDDLAAFLALDPADLPYEDTVLYEAKVAARAREDGVGLLLSGWGGDEFLSSHGGSCHAQLLLEGRWLRLWRELLARSDRRLRWKLATLLLPFRVALLGFPRPCLGAEILAPPWASARRPYGSPVRLPVRLRDFMLERMRGGRLSARLESWSALGARHGITHAFPLLDRRVLEMVLTFPLDVFQSHDEGRRLMRRLVAPWLPQAVADDTDKRDALRLERFEQQARIVLEAVAPTLPSRCEASRARFVDLAALRRKICDPDREVMGLACDVVQFLGVFRGGQARSRS